MSSKKYYIKGMVCERCIDSVRTVLESSDVGVLEISLGEVELLAHAHIDEALIDSKLKQLGFSLLKDPKQLLVKRVKAAVAEVYSGSFDFPRGFQFSQFIAWKLGASYKSISAVFSSLERRTLEQYIIHYKVDKIKEWLVYTDYSLSHIAFILGYSSAAHLSRQFKSFTGLNPSFFKRIRSVKNDLL